MRLYALSCPCVFYCDPTESGGVIVLWSIVWDRYACIPTTHILKLLRYKNQALNYCYIIIRRSLYSDCIVIV